MQTVVPMLAYRDGAAALDWLASAFGFVERSRFIDEQGRLAHGEMVVSEGLIMLATPTPDYEGPSLHRSSCPSADKWLSVPWVVDGILVYVEDVSAHCERARRAGAKLLSEVEHGRPGTRYRVEDIEGHRWMFMERSRDKVGEGAA
ncbi:MAG TPA: VOC family protein [Casimicrobiaceae bacterium]|nr:VOC family protein [Casimicrobiaceae bacterium]